MTGVLSRRGPDGEGFWQDGTSGVFLGFRRLAVLDLTDAGQQPMVSTSGRFVLVYNGEVYNFADLREELSRRGATFRGHSDTEVVLAAFDIWGPREAVQRFRGMFAFALWDRDRRELWLGRDRMGIKPLFLTQQGPAVIFASELRGVTPHPRVEARGDRVAVWHYLRNLYVPAPLSMLEGVEKVRPGVLVRLSIGRDGVERREDFRYWDLRSIAEGPKREAKDLAGTLDSLHSLLSEVVGGHLVADVPVGALLSGGIDSSLVVALMAEQSKRPVRTFTVRFDDRLFDEGPIAAEVASRLGTNHTEVELPSSQVQALLPQIAQLSDEPMGNPSLLPTFLVCQVARKEVVVALTGDGGDELFGGYNRYRQAESLLNLTSRIPGVLRPSVEAGLRGVAAMPGIETIGRLLQPKRMGGQHSFRERLRRTAGFAGALDEVEGYLELMAVGHSRPPMARPAQIGKGRHADPMRLHSGSFLSHMLLNDQLEYLPDDLLAKVDRTSMWASLEVRVPLLDHEVVRFSWTLPDEMKVCADGSKWLLRALARRFLPSELLERPKMGFTVPLARWLRNDSTGWLEATLAPERLRSRSLLDVPTVTRTLSRFRRGRDDLALSLWTVAALESWCSEHRVSFS